MDGRGSGHLDVFYICPQGFIEIFFYFVGLTTLGTLLFGLLSVQTFQPQVVIYRRDNLCIIIGDKYKFIVHCLISLDSLDKQFLSSEIKSFSILLFTLGLIKPTEKKTFF